MTGVDGVDDLVPAGVDHDAVAGSAKTFAMAVPHEPAENTATRATAAHPLTGQRCMPEPHWWLTRRSSKSRLASTGRAVLIASDRT
ncbi:hypothetical protein [Streptomyces sp. NPDC006640]|uniref:hypothetical protein n=1 Tax=unclassified Streptomyces TaxID=2593676 RepID=UPI0036A7A27F